MKPKKIRAKSSFILSRIRRSKPTDVYSLLIGDIMYKVPLKSKKSIAQEFKTYLPLVSSLVAKGKSSTEEDARILLNDILHSVLGYNKFNELKTEMRDKNGRIDYVVKLTDGPNKGKPERFDFVIEAKAVNVELNQIVVDQTLTYCLTSGVDYFVLTNAYKWQLFKVKRQGKTPSAIRIHEVILNVKTNMEDLAEEFYLFSRASFLNSDWKNVAEVTQATRTEDVVAVLLCDKVIHSIARELTNEHDVKVDDESVRDILEKHILKSWGGEYNKKLLKKLNDKPVKKETKDSAELKPVEANTDCEAPCVVEEIIKKDAA